MLRTEIDGTIPGWALVKMIRMAENRGPSMWERILEFLRKVPR